MEFECVLEGSWHVEDQFFIAGGHFFETVLKSGNSAVFHSFVVFPRLKAKKTLRKFL